MEDKIKVANCTGLQHVGSKILAGEEINIKFLDPIWA